MFGLFSKKPTSDQVVTYALEALRRQSPDLAVTRDGVSLRVRRGDRELVWNLSDVARLAPTNPDWKAEIDDLARQVVERRPATASPRGAIEVRLRPAVRVPSELKTGEMSAEPVLDDLWAIYGFATESGVSAARWSELEPAAGSRDALRTFAAATTLGAGFRYADMMSPVKDGIPLFTNAEFHPNVATALLMPPDYWQTLMAAFEPQPPTMLAAIPSSSRIFLTTADEPAFVETMQELVEASSGMEEELLSQRVYRFDGTVWRAIG
jgi:hypothetical protein